MKSRKYNAGFTLVEMLIVVAIIAILATMVVGLASRIDTKSKERALESTFALLDSALQEYYEYWNAFPNPDMPRLSHSAVLYKQLYSTPASQKILEKISPKLLRSDPNDADAQQICDPWGTVLDYIYDASINNFPLLKSAGPDKTFGNTDDITNR